MDQTSSDMQKHFERPTSHSQEFPMVKRIIFLVLVVAIGVTTGALGFIIASSQLPIASYIPYPSNLNFNQLQPQTTGRVIADAAAVAKAQTVTIIRSRIRTNDVYDQQIDPAEILGSGVAATSDGWVMTMIPAGQLTKVSVIARGTIYDAQRISTDPITGVSFLKTDVRFFNPVNISAGVSVGDSLVQDGASNNAAEKTSVARVLENAYAPVHAKLDYIRSSDSLSEYVLLESLSVPLQGQAFFTSDGRFAGFSQVKNNELLLIPGGIIKLALEQSLHQEVSRDLGISYMVTYPAAQDEDAESIIVFHPTRSPIKPGSLAANAGMKKGDSIRSIGGDTVSKVASFDYLWKKHQQDSGGVQLVIVRNGVEGPLSITW